MLSKPIFILGAHKSGTTLLRSLFDGTDNLCVVPFEPHIFEILGFSISYAGRQTKGKIIDTEAIKKNLIQYIKKVNLEEDIYGGNDANSLLDLNIAEKLISQISENDNFDEIIEKYYNSIQYAFINRL
tara:strand:- start:1087 stop:1470 length:384 start_codon:yes stop_codon:yes gene_type:complete